VAGLVLVACLAQALLLGAGGCGRDPQLTGEASRLLVIGIDSADWALLDSLRAEGRMPNFQAFREQATSGRMLSFRPLEKSPILWASILTGLEPRRHGVGGFVEGRDLKPVTSSAWLAPALWDIAGAAGLRTAILGMWTTYPAREIAGVMVSDYLTYGGHRERPLAGLVTPDTLTEIVAGLVVDPATLSPRGLGRFIPPAELARCEEQYPIQVGDLRTIWAADRSYLAVARWLAAHDDFDIFFFYLRGPDMIGHKFWSYFEPAKSPTRLSEEEITLFGQVVPRYYDWVDEVLGEVLGWFPERQVVILSDHGFHGPRHRPWGWVRGTGEHNPFGIFLVRSPYYTAGAWFDRMELLDIMPTLLAVCGLPASEEMPGVVLRDGLTDRGRRLVTKLESDRLPSYQSLAPTAAAEGEEDPEVDEKIRQQLRSLGYIE